MFGASFLAAAAFPADPAAGFPEGAPQAASLSGHGTVHMAAGMIGYLALCAASVVLASPLAARGHRAWAVASRLVPIAVLAGFPASAASVLAFTAGAGLGLCWLAMVAARLTGRRGDGEPQAAGRHLTRQHDPVPGRARCSQAPALTHKTTQGPDPLSRIRPLTWCFSCRGGGI
ncbi:DUF998 domain-containing protein [Streptomyces kanasensis]|uniref:DUF998 domain-containing protein n=1 Tax=Streptomyces kanasensis TaxID=936756 RepID=UPI0036F9FB0F